MRSKPHREEWIIVRFGVIITKKEQILKFAFREKYWNNGFIV